MDGDWEAEVLGCWLMGVVSSMQALEGRLWLSSRVILVSFRVRFLCGSTAGRVTPQSLRVDAQLGAFVASV